MHTRWGDLAVSDAHTHFFSHRFFQALASQASKSIDEVGTALGWQLPAEDPAELAHAWATELDRHGVAQAALIASIPGDESSVLAAVSLCPARFRAYAMVNPLAENAGVAEG